MLRRPEWMLRADRASLRADALAGLTGATIVLPQAVAFAAIAGLPPQYGFYTAIVPTIVAALAGSSWHAVSGPTTAISVLVFSALSYQFSPGSPAFVSAAIGLTLLVGIVQFLLAAARLGVLVDFVSHSVMTGFITGAALLIALSQVGGLLGLSLPRPTEPVDFARELAAGLAATDLPIVAVGLSAVAIGIIVRLVRPGWPNYLLALLGASGLSLALGGAAAGIPTIGAVGAVLPRFELPAVGPAMIRDQGSAALAIALVGLLEALSVSRAIAVRSGQPINGNREILGQGLSNIFGSFFQSYPSSASFTRSGVNYDAGARSPLAAILAALFLVLILALVGDWFALVPQPALAGVILLVAWRLIDFGEWRHVLASGSETAIAFATFGTTLLIDLEFAIYVGVILSILFFIRGASRPLIAVGVPDPKNPRRMFVDAAPNKLPECPQMMITRLDGPLFFGSVEFVRRQFRVFEAERPGQTHMLFIVKGVGEIDMPGADLLIEESGRRQRRGGSLHLQTRTPRTIAKLARFKVMRALTRNRIHLSKGDAISEMVPRLDGDICASCRVRIFHECARQPGGPLGPASADTAVNEDKATTEVAASHKAAESEMVLDDGSGRTRSLPAIPYPAPEGHASTGDE